MNRELRNMVLFSFGKFSSVFGTSIYTFAIGLYVLSVTGSGLSFALNLMLSVISMLIITPIAGILSDRFDRKKIFISMDLLNAVLLIGGYFWALNYGLSLGMIYILTLLMSFFTSIFSIAIESAIPSMVKEEELMKINSLSRIIDSGSSILGPVLGGMIFAFVDIRFFLLINGMSFLLSALSEYFINLKVSKSLSSQAEESPIESMKSGISYLKNSKLILGLIAVFVIFNFSFGFSVVVPLPYIINNVLQLSPTAYGNIQAFLPLGMIIGALVINLLSKTLKYEQILMLTSIGVGILIIGIGAPLVTLSFSKEGYTIYYSALMMFIGIFIAFVDIPVMNILQLEIEEAFRGRVLGVVITAVKVVAPIAFLSSGFFLNFIPVYIICFFGGGVLILGNGFFLKKLTRERTKEKTPLALQS